MLKGNSIQPFDTHDTYDPKNALTGNKILREWFGEISSFIDLFVYSTTMTLRSVACSTARGV